MEGIQPDGIKLSPEELIKVAQKQIRLKKALYAKALLTDVQPILDDRKALLKVMRGCKKCKSSQYTFVPCKRHSNDLQAINEKLQKVINSYRLKQQIDNIK